jgi:tetratricopeptide (TPR) repeat protein
VKRLVHEDPLNSVAHLCCALQDYFEGRYEAALAFVRVALRLDPTSLPARFYGVYLMAAEGQVDEAHALLNQWRTEAPEHPWMVYQTALVYAVEGRQTESMNLHARMLADLELQSVIGSEPITVLGYVHLTTLNGETDAAIEGLERGLELGLINYPFLAEKDRFLASLRPDPRFQELMVRVKKEWEEFEDTPPHESG